MGEYIPSDGSKHARARPIYGAKEGCPLSPLHLSIYLININDVTNGIQGACTGNPDLPVSHLRSTLC
eukprot:1155965-Pelagomonas_calceolata.AAC.2